MLDLDHTLINSAHIPEIDASTLRLLEARQKEESLKLAEASRTLFCLPSVAMWTKLRPGTRAFLAKAAAHFQLWIHTNSARSGPQVPAGLLFWRAARIQLLFHTNDARSGHA